MNKMIKEMLPNIRVANEARELVLNCCTEFIHLVSSESNEICNAQQKKTISDEYVLAALEKLGFGDIKKEAEEVLHECKETTAKQLHRRIFCDSNRSCSPRLARRPYSRNRCRRSSRSPRRPARTRRLLSRRTRRPKRRKRSNLRK